jgi:hypothetical protein
MPNQLVAVGGRGGEKEEKEGEEAPDLAGASIFLSLFFFSFLLFSSYT